jgi:hypothetical protein
LNSVFALTYLSSGFGAAGAPFPSGLTADVAGVPFPKPSSFAVVFGANAILLHSS